MALVFGGLLPSCFGTPIPSPRAAGPADLALNFVGFDGTGHIAVAGRHVLMATAPPQTDRASIPIRGFHEPGDWAHRNYCGAGAMQVLISAWLPQVPGIETVASSARLNPNRGVTGKDSVVAINAFLDPLVIPAVGHSWYRGEHVATLADLEARLRSDLLNPRAVQLWGHGVPVIVSTMTKTMPGWGRWNATHMITIYAFDFSHHDPARDTVSYAETPSPLAGYRGPDFQTISEQALWTAMEAYTVEAPWDPINVIW